MVIEFEIIFCYFSSKQAMLYIVFFPTVDEEDAQLIMTGVLYFHKKCALICAK